MCDNVNAAEFPLSANFMHIAQQSLLNIPFSFLLSNDFFNHANKKIS